MIKGMHLGIWLSTLLLSSIAFGKKDSSVLMVVGPAFSVSESIKYKGGEASLLYFMDEYLLAAGLVYGKMWGEDDGKYSYWEIEFIAGPLVYGYGRRRSESLNSLSHSKQQTISLVLFWPSVFYRVIEPEPNYPNLEDSTEFGIMIKVPINVLKWSLPGLWD